MKFRILPRDRVWRPRASPGTDDRCRGWLIHRGLLTRRIQAQCPDFSVRLLFQRRRRAFPDERFMAGPLRRLALVREVILACGAVPVVFAHSIARPRDLRGPWRALSRLGNRPLGEALFHDPRVRRHPLRYRRLTLRDPLHARACRLLGRRLPAVWARRSLFEFRGAPLLVTEVFLPELFDGVAARAAARRKGGRTTGEAKRPGKARSRSSSNRR